MELHTFKDSAGRVLAAFRGISRYGKGLGLKEIAEWRAELDRIEAELNAEIERRNKSPWNVCLNAATASTTYRTIYNTFTNTLSS